MFKILDNILRAIMHNPVRTGQLHEEDALASVEPEDLVVEGDGVLVPQRCHENGSLQPHPKT